MWRQAQNVLDSAQAQAQAQAQAHAYARRAIGETAVPFGVCTERSNVQAGVT